MQPPPTQLSPLVSVPGIVGQFGGALMLTALFLTLRRFVLRRAYFTAWGMAWLAFAVALLALVVRLAVVPALVGGRAGEATVVTSGLNLVYQCGKVLGLVFFVRGTRRYVAGAAGGDRVIRWEWVVAALYAVVSSFGAGHGLRRMIVWQTIITVPAFAYCAWAMLSLPRARRTAGSAITGIAFGLLGVLWILYGPAFTTAARNASGWIAGAALWLSSSNSYFDLALNLLLGHAMILLLMEDARREMDDAQTELRLAHDGLRRVALYDPLTDSLNRRAFAEGVGLEMARAAFGTVVIADLDNLKEVNDRYGHAAGDRLIRRCADALRIALRSYDKLYRWGGDEFLVVLPSARAADVLERLRQAVERAAPPAVEGADGSAGETLWLEVSFGAADYTNPEDLSVAIERADRAMYREKGIRKAGRRTSGAIAEPSPTSARSMR